MEQEISNEEYNKVMEQVVNADPADANACDSCQ